MGKTTMIAISGLVYLLGHNIEAEGVVEHDTVKLVNNIAPGALQILFTFVCFYCGVLACRLMMQRLSFCIPLYLSIPTTAIIIGLQCNGTVDQFPIDRYQWSCDDTSEHWPYLLISLVSLLSFLWTGAHIWFYNHEKLAITER